MEMQSTGIYNSRNLFRLIDEWTGEAWRQIYNSRNLFRLIDVPIIDRQIEIYNSRNLFRLIDYISRSLMNPESTIVEIYSV